jgi:hypothetical protein
MTSVSLLTVVALSGGIAGAVFGRLATDVVSATAQGATLRAPSAAIDLRVVLFSALLTVPRRPGSLLTRDYQRSRAARALRVVTPRNDRHAAGPGKAAIPPRTRLPASSAPPAPPA